LRQALDGIFRFRMLDFLLTSSCFDVDDASTTKGNIIFAVMQAPVERVLIDADDIDSSLPIALDALYSAHFDAESTAFSTFDEFFEYLVRFPLQVSSYLKRHFAYLFDDQREGDTAAVSTEDVHHLILSAGTVTNCLHFLEKVVERKGNTEEANTTVGDLTLGVRRRMKAVKNLLTKEEGDFRLDCTEVLDSDVAMLVARTGTLGQLLKTLLATGREHRDALAAEKEGEEERFRIIGELIDEIQPRRRT
jgi:hypothetical protein